MDYNFQFILIHFRLLGSKWKFWKGRRMDSYRRGRFINHWLYNWER